MSVIAGLLIDEFRYHFPLYREHQPMQAAGLTISRSSLSNWVHRTIGLLLPIYHSQLDSTLHSQVLAMDETPIRAGRKSKCFSQTPTYRWIRIIYDAEAICGAMSRPGMRFMAIKSIWQRDRQAAHRIREELIAQRTAKTNQIRGLTGEYGLIAPVPRIILKSDQTRSSSSGRALA